MQGADVASAGGLDPGVDPVVEVGGQCEALGSCFGCLVRVRLFRIIVGGWFSMPSMLVRIVGWYWSRRRLLVRRVSCPCPVSSVAVLSPLRSPPSSSVPHASSVAAFPPVQSPLSSSVLPVSSSAVLLSSPVSALVFGVSCFVGGSLSASPASSFVLGVFCSRAAASASVSA